MSQALAHSTRRRVAAIVFGGVAALAVGVIEWFAYLFYAVARGGTCLFGEDTNTSWGFVSWALATLIGIVLWVGFGVLEERKPGRTVRYVFGFAVGYAVLLVVLGLVSPLLWDPAKCGGGGGFNW